MSAFTGNTPTHDLAEEFLDRSTPLSRLRNVLHRYPAISPAEPYGRTPGTQS